MSRKSYNKPVGHHVELAEVRRLFCKELYACGFFDAAKNYEFTTGHTIAVTNAKRASLQLWANRKFASV